MGRAVGEIIASATLGLRAGIVAARAGRRVSAWARERDPEALARLDAAPSDGWVLLSDHLLLLEGFAADVGLDQLRSLARRRMRDRAPGTLSPGVVQSWTRSFAGDPHAIGRLGFHLWRNTVRNAGEMVQLHAAPGEIVVRFQNAPELAASEAWREQIAGTSLGIQDLAGHDLEIAYRVLDDETVDTMLHWVAATDSPLP